jgi:hypothetical protein
MAEILVHEIVHLEQQARQPGFAPGARQKDYRSYLAKNMDQFIAAIHSASSREDADIYHASPQEIPAYAHQLVYRLISSALGHKKLADVPAEEIPYAAQELRDALKDIANGAMASDDSLKRYLRFKDGDQRRLQVYRRFMKAVYAEVQSYISKLQQQMQAPVTETFDSADQIEETQLQEIELVSGQKFDIDQVKQILQHCDRADDDTIEGLQCWMGINGRERYVVLTDDAQNIAAYAGFYAIESHRWQAKNAQVYTGFTGRALAAKIYRELFDSGVSILSDVFQSTDGKKLWCSTLPKLGLKPMVWDSESEEIYTPDQIGVNQIYSTDSTIMHRYCWILDHHLPEQNLVYEGKLLLPLSGLWYTRRLIEMSSAGATCSGAIATISPAIGGMVHRPGSSILSGINTAEEFPNTPEWMRSYKKRSQNKKRSR